MADLTERFISLDRKVDTLLAREIHETTNLTKNSENFAIFNALPFESLPDFNNFEEALSEEKYVKELVSNKLKLYSYV